MIWLSVADHATLATFLSLTPRQQQVACCIARGMGSDEIGALLGIRRRTLHVHETAINDRFGLYWPETLYPRIELAKRLIRLANGIRDARRREVHRVIVAQYEREAMPVT